MHPHPVALVTGGSRGIVLEFARHGYAVAVNYAGNQDAARETQRLAGPDAHTFQADVASATPGAPPTA
jgi:NAD(P)-dependent dehydrogenase (short-subunit alcohol dehydrogenase family)